MRVLVNYGKGDKQYLSVLAYILKNEGHTALSTVADMTIGELLAKAKLGNCEAILLSNEQTLRYCVPGEFPTVDKWRGSRLNTSIPIIVINSLAHVHSLPHGEWLLRRDIQKIRSVRTPASKFTFTALTDVAMFSNALSVLSKAIFLAHDIETATIEVPEGVLEGGDTYISCAGWTGLMPNGLFKTFVLPLVDFGVDHWSSNGDYFQALLLLKKINALKIPKVMHNGMYDATHLIRYHAIPENYVLDTMALAHAEYAELPKTLDFVASYRLPDYIFWKDDSESAAKQKDISKYWAYNGKDTWHTARILIEQLRHSSAYTKTNYAKSFPLTYPALYCNFEGCLIDQDKRIELRTASSILLDKALKKLQVMFADPNFNPGSWQQVQKYIYTVFGAKHPHVGKSKSGTDEKNLLVVAEQHPLLAKLVTEILDYRGAQKAIGTYYDFLQYRGRLLWALNPFGTETGRMACSASSLWVGTQVQNVPSYAKGMLIADPGYELVEVDNKQSEGRTTAYCSQEEALIAALEDATKDFYKTLGTIFFQIPYEEVSEFFRNKVLKKIVHGTNYMMGGKTFIENIGIKILYETAQHLGIKILDMPRKGRMEEMTLLTFARRLLDAYHEPFPRVREWYKEIFTEIDTTGMLVSPLGHVRLFFGDIRKNHNMLRGAVAHQPQNLSVTILNKGLVRAYKEIVLPNHGEFRLKAQIHDSIFAQHLISKRDFYIPELERVMDNPVIVHGRTLRIPLDSKYGHNWGDTTKYKRPSRGV